MKTVLLVGDIGIGPGGYFHVGDEAMWLTNVRRYTNKKLKVYATSRTIDRSMANVTLVRDIYIPDRSTYTALLNSPTGAARKIIDIIKKVDLVHFSGGGNLTSLWPGHVYFRCFVAHFAHQFGKKVVATSQTVGPLLSPERNTIREIIPAFALFGVRDQNQSKQELLDLGLVASQIVWTPDDAISQDLLFNQEPITYTANSVALSLHSKYLRSLSLRKALTSALLSRHITSVPHVFSNGSHEMKNFIGLNHSDPFRTAVISGETIGKLMKNVISTTQHAPLVITSRYHGAVFALMAGRPVACIYEDQHYEKKFRGILEAFAANVNDSLCPVSKQEELIQKIKKLTAMDVTSNEAKLRRRIRKLETNLDLFYEAAKH